MMRDMDDDTFISVLTDVPKNDQHAIVGYSAASLAMSQQRVPICNGCRHEIFDKWILRVSPNLEWHAACLKCVNCQLYLDEKTTCFVRGNETYCRQDYLRLFGSRCARCKQIFAKDDYVMRARDKTFHVECFTCSTCERRLVPGEEFAMRGEDGLFCKLHPVIPHTRNTIDASPPQPLVSPSFCSERSLTSPHSGDGQDFDGYSPAVLQLPASGVGMHIGHTPSNSRVKTDKIGGSKKKRDDQKTTRVRTVLNEKQLHTLRTCYSANPRPDALMKEQLVEMTGLSPRVIRVWFQNKRCKDKKKQIAVKQVQRAHEQSAALTGVRMHGIGPLITGSPTTHDLGILPPVDISQFQQNPAIWGTPNSQHSPQANEYVSIKSDLGL